MLSEDAGLKWAYSGKLDKTDSGAVDYKLDDSTFLGGSSILGYGIVGGSDRQFRSDDFGRTWQTEADTLQDANLTVNGARSTYDFQHREYVGDQTLVALGIPSGTSSTPPTYFFTDYDLYRSTDSGYSWSVAGSIHNVYFPGKIVYSGKMAGGVRTYALMASYHDPVYGLRVGFFRSDDEGQNWAQENDDPFTDSVGRDEINIQNYLLPHYQLVYMGNGKYLANYVNTTSGNSFYVSDDGGNHWNKVSDVPIPGNPANVDSGIGEVMSLHYLGNNQVFAYIRSRDFSGGIGYPTFGGYRSLDGGITWNLTLPGLPLELETGTTPNYHTNEYDGFVTAIDNGAIPGEYDQP